MASLVATAFNGTVCVNETVTVVYVNGEVYNSTAGEESCQSGLTNEQTELVVGVLFGVLFGLFWVAGGVYAFYQIFKTQRKKRVEEKEADPSSVRTRTSQFEGTTSELRGYDQTINLLGDAQCLAAELSLQRMQANKGDSLGRRLALVYHNSKYFIVRTGIFNVIYLYELFVLSAFIFIDSINWGDQTVSIGLSRAFAFVSLDFPNAYEYLFWGTAIAYGLLGLMALLRRLGVRNGLFKDVLYKFYALFLFVLLIPAMKICMQAIDCVYRDPNVPWVYLEKNVMVQCFAGLHILNTVVAVAYIFGLYAAGLIYVVYIRKHMQDFIRYNATFEIVLIAGKTLLNAISVFFGSVGSGYFQLIVTTIIVTVFLVANYWVQPCRGKGAIPNSVRSGVYLTCVYGCACAFVALKINEGIPRSAGGNPAPFIAYFAGIIPMLLIGFFVNYPRARPLTIPDRPFRELLLDQNEDVRNMAALAITVSVSIDLTGSLLEDQHVKIIAEGVKASKRLVELNLSNNKIGQAGAKVLAEALKHNKSLRVLNLSRNYIGLEGSKFIAEAIKKNTTIERLILDRNGIRDEGAKIIAAAAKRHESLCELSLRANYLSDDVVPALAEMIKGNGVLQRLFLDDNKITDASADQLAEAVRVNSQLKRLSVARNRLSMSSMDSLTLDGHRKSTGSMLASPSTPKSSSSNNSKELVSASRETLIAKEGKEAVKDGKAKEKEGKDSDSKDKDGKDAKGKAADSKEKDKAKDDKKEASASSASAASASAASSASAADKHKSAAENTPVSSSVEARRSLFLNPTTAASSNDAAARRMSSSSSASPKAAAKSPASSRPVSFAGKPT